MSAATPPVKFNCSACGVLLSAPSSRAAISGPCPICGAWNTAPEYKVPATVSDRKKGRIRADTSIDHRHLENRESLQTLKIIALFSLATAFCLTAAWFLKQWMGD